MFRAKERADWMRKPGRQLFLACLPVILMLAALRTVLGDDSGVIEALRAFRRSTPSLRFFLGAFSDYATAFFYLIYAFILAVAVKKRDKAAGRFVGCFIVSFAATLLAVYVCKICVSRPRPFVAGDCGEFPCFNRKFHSFPSNHSSEALAATFPFVLRHRAVLFTVIIGVYNALAGFARLYLGSHYPSDVLGSLVVACLVNVLCLRLYPRIFHGIKTLPAKHG